MHSAERTLARSRRWAAALREGQPPYRLVFRETASAFLTPQRWPSVARGGSCFSRSRRSRRAR